MNANQRGFTLLEVLLVTALISVMAGFSAPVLARLQRSNDLQVAQQSLVQAHRRSQQLSRSSVNDQPWGVKIQTGSVTTFMGTSYGAPRDTTYDEVFEISTTISISGVSETVYDKVSATPSVTGSTSLINDGVTKVTTVNAKGTIEY